MKLLQGDCFEVMQGLEDNSIDLVLTDPPYGLSNGDTKGIADRIGSAFVDVVLPDLYDFNSKSGRLGKFAGPLDCVSFLDFMNRAFREEPRIAMPESAVNLQCAPIAEQEIENKSESAIVCTDGKLHSVVDSDGAQFCRDYAFYPRACLDSSVCDSKRIGLRQLGPGRFGMPVVISLNSELARFLCTLTPCGPSFLSDIVGLCNNAQTLPCTSPGIVTGGGAEIGVVLSFDTRNGTVEFLPASGALQGDIVLDVFAAKNVGASAGACCLSPKFKPSTFGIIGNTTDRAITFYFHDSIMSEIETTRKGFMGKTWDGNVPDTAIWVEALRVLKPGGHLLSFSGDRTYHRMACRIEDAGLEIRSMAIWAYGSGYPKSKNHLKPAIEPIVVARKQVVGTTQNNINSFGVGGLNINDCRIGGADGRWPANLIHDGSEEVVDLFPTTKSGFAEVGAGRDGNHTRGIYGAKASKIATCYADEGSASRFFMTLPFEKECALCYNTCAKASNNDTENETWKIILARNAEKSGWTSQAISEFIVRVNVIGQANVSLAQNARSAGSLCDSCAMSIAVALAGIKTSAFRSEELGVILASIGSSKSSILLQNLVSFAELWGDTDTIPTTKSLSLLFGSVRDAIASSTKKASEEEAAGGNGQEKETLCRLKYCAKASKRERDGSIHPTMKPIALMEYLVKLASSEGQTILDPFMGSGTTGIACQNLNRKFIGIEMNEEYFETARNRINNAVVETLF